MKAVRWAGAAVLFGLALFEVSMRPTSAERFELASIFVVMGAVMALTSRLLPALSLRVRSLRKTMVMVALTAFAIVVGGTVAVGNRMFLSGHDLTLLLVVMAFGAVTAVGLAVIVSRTLNDDIVRLVERADAVADGNLHVQAAVMRNDEIARLSDALDRMVAHLDLAEAMRQEDSRSRRDFFTSLGHDLRTPISSMRASLDAFRDGVFVDFTAMTAVLEQNVEVLAALVEDLYMLARLDSGAMELERSWIDITELVDETIEVLGPLAAERGIVLQLVAADRVFGLSSPQTMSRVLRNLADNSIRHSPDRGTVRFEVLEEAGEVVVSVVDDGPGFASEFRDVAFERFTRADQSRGRATGGSGLGLAIAKALVESMGGSIWIDDGPGAKVVFTLTGSSTRAVLARTGTPN